MNEGEQTPRRVWSWAASDLEVAERREHVEGLVGNRIALVRYVTIDYLREESHPELIDSGVRLIDDARELERPTWRFDGFDALDFGIELETVDGVSWSLTWDPPGDHEGIGLRKGPMLGSVVSPDGLVAVWEATLTSLWSPMLRAPIETVELHYTPWDRPSPGFWCPRISFVTQDARLEVVMGDDEHGRLVASADNVAILAPETPLPPWPYLAD
ncbi:hypothetical protein [Pengzhenrongella sp.]|jgi:hypothetical protein|uniref:hypothetical protein n=1 Tax=Pengzhenrongella sp. TaxID=2888820 RepID=UPI002F91F5F6